MTTIGYATLQIIPSARGTQKALARDLGGMRATGRSVGRDLAAGISDGVAKAESGLDKARKAQIRYGEVARASGAKVRIEETKLQELRKRGITDGSRWMAQQERLTAAQNRARNALHDSRNATQRLTTAQQRMAEVSRTSGSQTAASMGQIATAAEQAGTQGSSRFLSAFGAIKVGAAAVAASAGAVIGTSFAKGLQRLTAIDDAQGKLAALGHSTSATAHIMESALASVKGTSYGLGDAANIAASAVAANIKPGEQLTKYLTMTADAAAIAGTGLGEMGSILNKVQNGTVAYTGDLNMLADRGLPIYQWLQEELKVSATELKTMVSAGEIDSATYFRAIEKNVGGAAKVIGSSTVRGAWENLGAAMGRAGAAALGPTFARLPGWLSSATGAIDAVTPRVQQLAQALDAKIFEEWGPKIVDAIESLTATGELDRAAGTFKDYYSAVGDLLPSIGQLARGLGEASAALGVSGWELFLTTVQASTTVLNILNPLLSTAADLVEDNRGAVTLLLAAWLAFKTVPTMLGRVTAATTGLSNMLGPAAGKATATATAMKSAAIANGAYVSSTGQIVRSAGQATFQMGRFGSSVAQIGQHVPMVGRMQQSFFNASTGAQRFGRTAGVAAAAGTGLRAAGAGVAGVFGGPVGLALAGTAIAGTYVASKMAEAKQQTQALSDSSEQLVDSQRQVQLALTAAGGAVNDDVLGRQATVIDDFRGKLDSAADTHKTFMEGLTTWDTNRGQLNAVAEEAGAAARGIDALNLSNEELAKVVTGSQGAYNDQLAKLREMGPDGEAAARALTTLRVEFNSQQHMAKLLTPGMSELSEAMRVLGDESSSSSSKLAALTAAMDAMSPARNEAEAVSQYAESIRQVADAAAGIGPDAFGASGGLDAMTESGTTLQRTLSDLADKAAQVASSGGDMSVVTAQNEQAFRQLADATGQPIEKIRELYDNLGGATVDIAVEMSGADDVVKELAVVKAAMDRQPGKKTFTFTTDQITENTRKTLEALGAKVTELPDGKSVQVDAVDNASVALSLITQNANVLGAMKVTPNLDLNASTFAAKNDQALSALRQLDLTHVDPSAGIVIQDLLNGQAVSMNRLIELRDTTVDPQARLLIDQLLQNVNLANTELNNAARPRDAVINVKASAQDRFTQDIISGRSPMPQDRIFDTLQGERADGAIHQYANGGIQALETYANGGSRLPDRAVIQKPDPRGGLIQWAEPETGGEAFIPLALSKRKRSTDILAELARMFGYSLLPNDQVPNSLSGLLGAVSGGAVSKLLKETGVDSIERFADGGITNADLRRLADGAGASRPLTGAPYDWAGINWGDCSAAMSAFARKAAGLAPFGGRFATGSMREQLAQMGAQSGRGGPGDLRFGWFNGGPYGGHTAGTLPDGTNIEMGGGYGGGMVGGTVGSDDSSFTDHAFFPITPERQAVLTGVGDDPATGYTPGAPGNFAPGNGNFGAGGGTGGFGGSGDSSISGRAGSVASAFITGQLQDAFEVLGANDQPGWLAMVTEYENSQRRQQDGSGTSAIEGAASAGYEQERAQREQDFEAEKATRQSEYEADKAELDAERDAKRISQAEYDRRAAELKRKFDEAELAEKQEFEEAEREAKRKFDELARQQPAPQAPPKIVDPGTDNPAPGHDLGGGDAAGVPSTGNPVKDAFRSGMREAWRQGPPWEATDWIINKESTWQPGARNGKYFGAGQYSPDVWAQAGKTPTEDPKVQGEVFDHYVDGRYQTPEEAKAHHLRSGWYDRGGRLEPGETLVRNELGHTETALPFEPEDLLAALQSWDTALDAITTLSHLIDADNGNRGTVINNITTHASFRDEDEYYRNERRRARLGLAQRSGGRLAVTG